MNQRFVILTFTACTVMFAGIWAATAPTPRVAAAPAASASAAVTYADCDAVRAANAAPLRAGQPGYRAALDANMNGVACETMGASAPSAPAVATSATEAQTVSSVEPLPDPPPPPQPDLPPPDPATTRFPPLQ